MKIEIGKRDLMNVLHLFDTNGDNSIDLAEFERQMAKYMGGYATGKIQEITSAKDIDSKIIPEQLKQELVEDMRKEQKKTVKYEDFGFKAPALNV